MESKNYYHKLINNNKIKEGSDVVLPNGDIDLHLILSQNNSTPKSGMTNNDIAKIVQNLVTVVSDLSSNLNNLTIEVREGFKQVNTRLDRVEERLDRVEERLDKIELRLDVVEDKLERNNII